MDSYINRISRKYLGEYTNEVFDNFYNMSLEDRIILIDKLININKSMMTSKFRLDNRDNLELVKRVTMGILQAEKFPELYSRLNDKQKKELQTQIYEASSDVKKRWYAYDYDEWISRIYIPFGEYKQEEKTPFVLDTKKLQEEFNMSRVKIGYVDAALHIFSELYSKYAFDYFLDWNFNFKEEEVKEYRRKCTIPLIKELNNATTKVLRVLKNNLNESTLNMFNSLNDEQQISVIFEIVDNNEEYLDRGIKNREERRNKRKEKEEKSLQKYLEAKEEKKARKIKQRKNTINSVYYRR